MTKQRWMPQVCIFLSTIAVDATALGAEDAAPVGPREELSFFVGNWTVEGSESTYLESCQWLTRESFVVCRAEDKNPQDKSVSLSILGYSEEEQAYTYASFDGSGGSRTLHAWVHGDQWVFTGGRDSPSRSTRWQVTITPNEKGFHFRQEVSANGSPWATNFEILYLRLP